MTVKTSVPLSYLRVKDNMAIKRGFFVFAKHLMPFIAANQQRPLLMYMNKAAHCISSRQDVRLGSRV